MTEERLYPTTSCPDSNSNGECDINWTTTVSWEGFFFEHFGAEKRGWNISSLQKGQTKFLDAFWPNQKNVIIVFKDNYSIFNFNLYRCTCKIIFNERFGKWPLHNTFPTIFQLEASKPHFVTVPGIELVRLVPDQIARNSLGQGALMAGWKPHGFLKDLHRFAHLHFL